MPSHAFELAEVLWIGTGMHGEDRHDEAHAISGSDFVRGGRSRVRFWNIDSRGFLNF